MKKMVFIAGALMLVVASSAIAGSDLGWLDCVAGGGAADRTVACSNTGSSTAYASLNPTVSYPVVGATDVFIDVAPAAGVGAWWNTNPITTRWGANGVEPVSGACPGWWANAANGGLTFAPVGSTISHGTINKLRLKITTIVSQTEEQPMEPGTNYFLGALQLKFNAGTFANAECVGGAAIGIANVIVYQPNIPDSHLGQVAEVSNCATFRNPPTRQCPGATPTEKSTWGSIKALYR